MNAALGGGLVIEPVVLQEVLEELTWAATRSLTTCPLTHTVVVEWVHLIWELHCVGYVGDEEEKTLVLIL